MIAILISFVVFISYLSYILIRYKIQPSISDSYYRLTGIDRWLFTLSTWGYTVPLVASVVTWTKWTDLLIVFAGGLLCMVGIFPDFRITKRFHEIGAEGGILLAFIWILTTPIWFIAIPSILIIAFLFWRKPRNHTFWIEVLSYFSILTSIYLTHATNL